MQFNKSIVGLCVYVALSLTAYIAEAQSIRRQPTAPAQKTVSTAADKEGHTSINEVVAKYEEDTVYCFQTKKQHGWFAPLGIMTKEQARHRNMSYRMTKRNSQGYWCRLEMVDSYGNYVADSRISPYILNINTSDSDPLVNQEWVNKIKTICIYELIPDETGKQVIQERAYDKDMNLVFVYSRVPIGVDSLGRRQFIGSYRDNHGFPAEMRRDTTNTYTYGTLVKLTEDEWGNDSIVEYMDAKGIQKPNSDGVAMCAYIHDKDGHMLKQQSRDVNGNLTIDNWGNCGVECVYGEDHTILSITYMNDSWEPMRMPAIRTDDDQNVIKKVYKYDEYFRNTEQAYFSDTDVPDVDINGIHKKCSEYDDHGNCTLVANYDVNGQLTDGSNGIAIGYSQYDNAGRRISSEWFDKNNKPCPNENYLSRVYMKYDENGKEILNEQYSIVDGQEQLHYKHEIANDYEYIVWSDGTCWRYSYDDKGRMTSSAKYDKDGDLVKDEDLGWAKEETEYDDSEHSSRTTYYRYDESGNLIDGIAKSVYVTDSLSRMEYCWKYNADGTLEGTYINKFDSDFIHPVAQYDANKFGVICRAGGTSDVRIYKADVTYGLNREHHTVASLIGKDEFDEPEYIDCNESELYYYKRISGNGKDLIYDENNNVITDSKRLRDSLPKVMSIEVADSIAYKAGLRDNDIILLYGDYHMELDKISSYYDFRRDWTLFSVLYADDVKRMVVFRINPETLEYGIEVIDGLKGTPSELGIVPHIRYLTKKQRNRILDTIAEEVQSANPLFGYSDFTSKTEYGENMIIMAYPDMYRSVRNKPYASQIADPAIVLGASLNDKLLKWTFGEEEFDFENIIRDIMSHDVKIYLTKDMHDTALLNLTKEAPYTAWFDTYVSDKTYDRLSKLAATSQAKIAQEQEPLLISEKSLYGYWKTVDNEGGVDGYLYLMNDGTCQGRMADYGTIEFNAGTAVFKIEKSYDGTWSLNNNCLNIVTPDTEDDVMLSCVDVQGVDEALRDRAIRVFNRRCKENKDDYIDYIDFHFEADDVFWISAVTAETLTINDGNDNGNGGISLIRMATPQRNKQTKTEKVNKSNKNNDKKLSKLLENDPIIGEWDMRISDENSVQIHMSFDNTGKMQMNSSMVESYEGSGSDWTVYYTTTVDGVWSKDSDIVIVNLESESVRLAFDVDVYNAPSEEYAMTYKNMLIQYFESPSLQLEYIMGIIGSNVFNSVIRLSRLSDNEYECNGLKLDRCLIN